MKAVVYDKSIKPHKQKFEEIDKPNPTENEVLVKIHCVSLNAADYRSIQMGLRPKKGRFGSAISGVIESVGTNVTNFKPGDEILADVADFGFGGLAEYTTIPKEALVAKPDNVPFEDAATLPVAATTALKALRDKTPVKQGDKILVVGSAGGVGTFAIQLAKHFDAEVTGVCSTKNIEQTLALGANKAVDYTKEDFTRIEERYDLILAINGNYPLLSYLRLLKPKGTCVVVGGSLGQIFKTMFFGWFLSLSGKKVTTLAAKGDAKNLEYVTDLMRKGELRSLITKRYSFDQTIEAMNELSKGHTSGKVIINV